VSAPGWLSPATIPDVTRTLAFLLLAASVCPAAELKPETVQAYDKYISDTASRLASEKSPFLWIDRSPERLAKIKQGQVIAEAYNGKGSVGVPGGAIHDYIGAIFIPGATLEKTLAAIQDYDHQKSMYPDTLDSKLISHTGNDFKYWRVRRLEKGFAIKGTVYTAYDAHFEPAGPERWVSQTRSTDIREIENYGKPDEKKLPAGNDQGLLWRLSAFWRLEQRDGGVYLECEAITLSRALKFYEKPFGSAVNDLEIESMTNTMKGTRDAAKK
jgi:hypothetical protein